MNFKIKISQQQAEALRNFNKGADAVKDIADGFTAAGNAIKAFDATITHTDGTQEQCGVLLIDKDNNIWGTKP